MLNFLILTVPFIEQNKFCNIKSKQLKKTHFFVFWYVNTFYIEEQSWSVWKSVERQWALYDNLKNSIV